MLRLYPLIIIFFLLIHTPLLPQQSDLHNSVTKISSWIASDDFKKYLNENGDLKSIDTLFSYALSVNDNNFSEALFSLTFSVLPYKVVPLTIPFINLKIDYPVISANDSIFQLKNKNLPKNIFFDSPQNSFGDKDKLAHFFGNAFISYSANLFDLTPLIGYFVEVFEETFKVSRIDRRDLTANRIGISFGKDLKKNKLIKPSDIILSYNLTFFRINL